MCSLRFMSLILSVTIKLKLQSAVTLSVVMLSVVAPLIQLRLPEIPYRVTKGSNEGHPYTV
jgi:hypothetical protein